MYRSRREGERPRYRPRTRLTDAVHSLGFLRREASQKSSMSLAKLHVFASHPFLVSIRDAVASLSLLEFSASV